MRFWDDKYDHSIFAGNNIMATTIHQDLTADRRIESKREIIRECLDEIIVDVEGRLRAAALSSTIFLTVPHIGGAVMTMASPLDPSDDEWADVVEIVCKTVSERLNGLKLRSRDMTCAMVNAAMSAADVTAD
jgi:hypothetical protein